jgi:hypothetical protein
MTWGMAAPGGSPRCWAGPQSLLGMASRPRTLTRTAREEFARPRHLPRRAPRGHKVVRENAGATCTMPATVSCSSPHQDERGGQRRGGPVAPVGESGRGGRLTGLLIGNSTRRFSAGANLFALLMAINQKMWDQVVSWSRIPAGCPRLRYSDIPVVIAPASGPRWWRRDGDGR